MTGTGRVGANVGAVHGPRKADSAGARPTAPRRAVRARWVLWIDSIEAMRVDRPRGDRAGVSFVDSSMTGPLSPFVHPPQSTERAAPVDHGTTVARRRALTQSTRAVTQSVAVVADILRSAKRPAVLAQGLMPSRLRRWSWKAGDLAWNVVGAIGVLASIVVLAFIAYVVVTFAIDAVFG